MKRTSAMLAIFISLILISAATVCVLAESSGRDSSLTVDSMSSPLLWRDTDSIVSGTSVSKEAYSDESHTSPLGEDDSGYTSVSRPGALSGESASIKRTFEESINLYGKSELSFDFFAAAPEMGASGISYTLTVTLFSDGEEYAAHFPASLGQWQKVSLPLEDWSRYTKLTAIAISLSVDIMGERTADISYSVDNIIASGTADTSFEDTFLSRSFEATGAHLFTSDAHGTLTLRHTASASVTGFASFRDRGALKDHNTLRMVLTTDGAVNIKLLVSHSDGEAFIGDTVTVSASTPRAFYFEFPRASTAEAFTLLITSEKTGTVVFYGIDTLYMPPEEDGGGQAEELGSLSECTVDSTGSVNLRGTVTTDTVVNHYNGLLAVYAVPFYEDAERYIISSSPLAVMAMTTRFNVTIPEFTLPDGFAAHRYVVAIEENGEKLIIDEPRLPSSDGAGAIVPIRAKSLKGIAYHSLKAGQSAALTEIEVNLSELAGSPSTGRMYSAFGKLFYFNSEYLKKLDAKIRSLSLSGTDVYLRLTKSTVTEDGRKQYEAVTADTKEQFEDLYAAVDFITQHYSSGDYGYVSGMIAGHTSGDLRLDTSPAAIASSMVNTAAVVYGAGMSNINDFRVMLPFGDTFVSTRPEEDAGAELLLRLTAHYAERAGLVSYGIIWQSDKPESDAPFSLGLDGSNTLKQYLNTLSGTLPSFIFMEYTPESKYCSTDISILENYLEAYYLVCDSLSVSGFIYNLDIPVRDEMWLSFIRYFALIDTDRYKDAEEYVAAHSADGKSPTVSDGAAGRAHPYCTIETPPALSPPGAIIGSYKLFDYTESFDTGGWFALDPAGECFTVKSGTSRMLRALGSGIMYSCASSPLDLSVSPIISVDLPSAENGEYELIVFSDGGSIRTAFTSYGAATVYVDISALPGSDAVTGIMLLSKDGSSREIFVRSISVHSTALTGEELSALYLAEGPSESKLEEETNVIEIVAVIFSAIVLSAAAFSLIKRFDK